MKFLFFSFFIFFLFSCQHIENERVNRFENPSREVVEECLRANPKLSPSECNVKDCFSDPYILHGIIEITQDVTSILEKLNINYMINSATLFGALRFKAPLPWDDDVDIDVIENEFEAHLKEIQAQVRAKGYKMKVYKSHPFASQIDFWQVYYTEFKYKALLSRVNPQISSFDIERLWRAYLKGDHVPHFDIFLLSEENSKFTLRGPLFSHQSYTRDERYQAKDFMFLDKAYKGPANPEKICSKWYGGGDAVRDFVVYPPHRTVCGKPRFKNIRKYPKTFEYMKKYLKYVYGDKYQGAEMP